MADWTGPIDKLEAINLIIRQQGQAEIATLGDISSSVVAQKAEQTLSEISRQVQGMELWFNVERDYELTADGSGYFNLPAGTIRVDTIIAENAKDYVQRGTKLYDVVNHTNVFTVGSTIKVKLVVALDYDELPESAKWYIAVRAARKSIGQNQVSITATQLTAQDEKDALAVLMEEDSRADDRTMAQASPHMQRMRRGQK